MANSHVSYSTYCLNLPLHEILWEWCYCYYLVLIFLNVLAEAYTLISISQQNPVTELQKGSNFAIHRLKLEVPIYWFLTFSRQKSLVEQHRVWIHVLKQTKSHNSNSEIHPSTQPFWRPHTLLLTNFADRYKEKVGACFPPYLGLSLP